MLFNAMVELVRLIDEVAEGKRNVSELLDALITDALSKKASDIHIEAKDKDVLLVRYRIDGVLRDILTIGHDLEDSVMFIVKVRAKLRTDIHFAPQDGKILFKVKKKGSDLILQEEEVLTETPEGQKEGDEPFGKKEKKVEEKKNEEGDTEDVYNVDARISILPVTHGEKVVIRLLSQANRSFALEDLGLEGEDLIKLEKAYSEPYGLILATGPTGSGKTTTLYSILKILNKKDVNITTIEDPVEYSIEGVNHIQINTKADLTFVNGLRSILRQDPDIIMVGEIRDTETARITVNSALTGHLVLSTLHANDAVSTIPRLLEMGIEPFLVASTINIIVTQRLARRLCENCKTPYVVGKDEKHKELLKLRPDVQEHIKDTEQLYRAQGCKKCGNTGYSGRVGIYEVLSMSKEIRDMIIRNPNSDDLLEVAKKQGFKLMIEDGLKKLREGTIDIQELIKVIALRE